MPMAATTPFGRTIDDVTKRDEQDWRSILVHSSNVGMFKMSERITRGQLHGIVDRFGFGSVTRIGLPGESPGIVLHRTEFPTPRDVAGKDPVHIGRIRADRAFVPGLALWCVMDQLRKGAALNAIQIAETAVLA